VPGRQGDECHDTRRHDRLVLGDPQWVSRSGAHRIRRRLIVFDLRDAVATTGTGSYWIIVPSDAARVDGREVTQ
jgi:hypothetical protein